VRFLPVFFAEVSLSFAAVRSISDQSSLKIVALFHTNFAQILLGLVTFRSRLALICLRCTAPEEIRTVQMIRQARQALEHAEAQIALEHAEAQNQRNQGLRVGKFPRNLSLLVISGSLRTGACDSRSLEPSAGGDDSAHFQYFVPAILLGSSRFGAQL